MGVSSSDYRTSKFTLKDQEAVDHIKHLVELLEDEENLYSGYYFDEGYNDQICKTIQYLFNERVKKKKEGNAIQEVYKLLMNSAYGKLIMKAITEETKFIKEPLAPKKERLVETREDLNVSAESNSEAPKVKSQPYRAEAKTGRNDPCPCGSGKKYKTCHGR